MKKAFLVTLVVGIIFLTSGCSLSRYVEIKTEVMKQDVIDYLKGKFNEMTGKDADKMQESMNQMIDAGMNLDVNMEKLKEAADDKIEGINSTEQ